MGSAAVMGRLRPSKAFRWVPCPGSVTLEEQQPETEPDEGAKEGTAAHDAAQLIIAGSATPDSLIDRRAENGIVISDTMVDHVMTYVDALNSYKPGVPRQRYLEQWISCYVVHEDNDGTPDCVDWFPDTKHLVINDFKYGWGIVEAFSNWQMIDYAGGWCAHLGWEPKTITLRVIQPRPVHKDGPVREWNLTTEELLEYLKVMQTSAVDSVNVDDPVYRVGLHCTDCTGRHQCTALHNFTMQAVELATKQTPFDIKGAALGAEIKVLRRAVKLLKARLAGLEADAEARLTVGKPVGGFLLEPRNGHRAWKGTKDDVKALGSLYGANLMKEEPVTPAAAIRAKIPKSIVESPTYTERPYLGHKLVEGDPVERAKELFKND